jgi:hypothetical protein
MSRGKRQEARGKMQEAGGKRQDAGGKRQEGGGRREEGVGVCLLIDKRFGTGTIRDPSLHPGKAPGFPFDRLRASCSG